MTLTAYLLFHQSCQAAMTFYQTCFGGELTMTKVGDSAMKTMLPAALHDQILHAQLKTERIQLSASDWLRPDQTPMQGNTVCLYLSGGSPDELKTLFEKLSEKATVTDPLTEHFFGTYGALNDQFGIRWMFQAEKK